MRAWLILGDTSMITSSPPPPVGFFTSIPDAAMYAPGTGIVWQPPTGQQILLVCVEVSIS